MEDTPSSCDVRECLERLRAGDETARNELIALATERLYRLARKMLRQDFRDLKRWLDTSDVFQNAVARLCIALGKVTPESPLHFHRLASLQLRRELIDLSRHYFGPEGHGANHASVSPSPDAEHPSPEPAGREPDPAHLSELREMHGHVHKLPPEEMEVVDLIFYQGLSQEAAALEIGCTVRTVQRRWQLARIHLHQMIKGEPPAA